MTNIQELLCQEYDDFADVILIESPFILVTPHSHGVQPVKAAFTPDKLIIAVSTAGDKESQEQENGELELMKLLPLPFIQITILDRKRKRLQVQLCNNEIIYLEFQSGAPRIQWKEWEKKIRYLNRNSYSEDSPFKIDPNLVSIAEGAGITKKSKKKKRGEKSKKHKRKSKRHQERVDDMSSSDDGQEQLAASAAVDKHDRGSPSRNALEGKKHRRGGPVDESHKDLVKMNKNLDENKTVAAARREATRARWRKLAIQTRFVFHKNRRVTFGMSEIFARAYSPKLKGFNCDLRRATSMSGAKAKSFHEFSRKDTSDPDDLLKERRASLRRTMSLPLVFEGEATFLESQPSSQTNLVQNSHKLEDNVSFIRYRRFASTDQGKFRRPSFMPPTNSHAMLRQQSSNESIGKVFDDVQRDSRISLFLTPHPEEETPTTSPKKRRKSFLKRLLSPTRSREKLFSKKKDKYNLEQLDKTAKTAEKAEPEDNNSVHSDNSSVASENAISFGICSPMTSKGHKFDEDTLRKNMIIFVLTLDTTTVAKELTMIVKKLFFNIPSSELTDCLWTKKDKYKRAPNIMTMIDFFERIANLVATQILNGETIHERAKLCRKFISIAEKCHRIQNFNSLRSILGGLQITPVFRLEKTWNHVMSKYPRKYKSFQELSDLMSHEENFAKYRSALEKAMDIPPCMPFIGVFLQTVLALDTAKDVTGHKNKKKRNDSAQNGSPVAEGSPGSRRRASFLVHAAKEKITHLYHVVKHDERDSITSISEIHDDGHDSDQNNNDGQPRRNPDSDSKRSSSGQRHRKLTLFECSDDDLSDDGHKRPAFLQMKPKDMLFHYQIAALPYNFPSNPSVRDFLLHADYLPDDENYKISLLREPHKPKK